INPFQNSELTFSGTGQVRSTPQSSGYIGASGGRNVYLQPSVGTYFTISGIDTSKYESLSSLSFGVHKNRTEAIPIDSTQFVVEVATDYDLINNTGTFVALSYPTLMPTGWSLITIDGSIIPLTSNLAIR